VEAEEKNANSLSWRSWMKEIQDCVLEKNRTSNVRFFRFGRLRKAAARAAKET